MLPRGDPFLSRICSTDSTAPLSTLFVRLDPCGITIFLTSQDTADPVRLPPAPCFATISPDREVSSETRWSTLNCNTEAHANLGITEDVIQVIGRWSSITWKIHLGDRPTVRMEQLSTTRCCLRSPSSFLTPTSSRSSRPFDSTTTLLPTHTLYRPLSPICAPPLANKIGRPFHIPKFLEMLGGN